MTVDTTYTDSLGIDFEEYHIIRFYEYLPEILDDIRGLTVLDIGCSGDNGRIHRVLGTSAAVLHGIDIDPIKGMDVQLMDIEREHAQWKYKRIIMSGIFDHLHNPGMALHHVSQMSYPREGEKEGTVLYIAVPNIYQMGHVFRAILNKPYQDDFRRKYYADANIQNILECYCWKVHWIRYNRGNGPGRLTLHRRFLEWLLPERLHQTMVVKAEYIGGVETKYKQR